MNTSLDTTRHIAFMSSMLNIMDANVRHKNNFTHKVLKENIANVNLGIFYPKDFYLTETVDKKISYIVQSGIMNHMIGKYVDLKYWNIKKARVGPQQLNLQHLQGTFTIWIFSCGFSFVVFTIELSIGCACRESLKAVKKV